MFERFTDTARHVVVQAQDDARRLGHGYIGCEHLLLAAAADRRAGRRGPARPGRHARTHQGGNPAHQRARPDGRPGGRPGRRGAGVHRHRPGRRPRPDRGGVRPGRPHPGPPGRPPAQAASLGEGPAGRADAPPAAVAPAAAPPCLQVRSGNVPLLPGSFPGPYPVHAARKKTLALSLRESEALHDNYIGVQHLTLALLRPHDGTVPEILSALGAPATSLRAAILARYRKAS